MSKKHKMDLRRESQIRMLLVSEVWLSVVKYCRFSFSKPKGGMLEMHVVHLYMVQITKLMFYLRMSATFICGIIIFS